MDSVSDHNRLYAAAAALLTGLFLYFGSGLNTIPALTWLAPLPALLVAPLLTKRLTALTAFIGWSLGLANLWTYLLNDLELPPAALSFLVLLAGVFTLTVLLFRALILRGRYALAAFTAPASWAAADYLIALVSPHGAFTSLGYTQVDVHPVAQIASLTGVWGLSYLLLTPAAVVAAVVHAPRRTGIKLATTLALIAIGTFSYGAWRLSGDEPSQAVEIAIVSASNGLDDTRWSGANGRRSSRRTRSRSRRPRPRVPRSSYSPRSSSTWMPQLSRTCNDISRRSPPTTRSSCWPV